MPHGLSRAPRRSRFTTLLLVAITAAMVLPAAVAPQTVHAFSGPTPTVSSLSPEAGPTTGGTTVTISGSNFDTILANDSVSFGSVQGTVVSVTTNGSQMTVSTPSGVAEGQVQVTVTTTAGGPSLPGVPATLTTFQFTNPGPFHPLTARICDSVAGSGTLCSGTSGDNLLYPGQVRPIQVTGVGGIPSSGVAAIAMNLYVAPTAGGYGSVGVYPTGLAGGASSLSWVNGNFGMVLIEIPVSPQVQVNGQWTGGQVNLASNLCSGCSAVNYILDVQGYVSDTQTDASGLINSLPQSASSVICNTASSSGSQCAVPNNAGIGGGTYKTFNVLGQGGVPGTPGQVPSGVSAVVLNVQTYAENAAGWLLIFPANQSPQPGQNANYASMLWNAWTPATNHIIVPVDSSGKLTIYNGEGPGSGTQVSIGVDGWITDSSNPNPTGSLYYPNNGTMVCDTIAGTGTPCSGTQLKAGAPPTGNSPMAVQISGLGGVPAAVNSITGVELSLTVTNESGVGNGTYVCVYPSGGSCQGETDLNLYGGVPANLLVIVPLGPDGKVDVATPTGSMDVLLAVTGYYAADPPTLPTTWTQFAPATSPPGRTGFAMTYDAARQQDVMFGGNSGLGLSNLLNDTWIWSGGEWNQESPATSPSPRQNAMMAYDPVTQTDILFGGTTGSGDVADTWSWNGTTWTQLSPATSPSARDSGFMAYDQALGEVVLFGGNSTLGNLTDTWSWNGTTWTQQTGGSSTPPSATGGAMTYDEARNDLVYIDGSNQQVWLWGLLSGATGWGWTSDGTTPVTTSSAGIALAYDPMSETDLLFGGSVYPGSDGVATNATWSWNGTTWSQLTEAASPPARLGGQMVTDDDTGDVLLFGGTATTGSFLNDTWTANAGSINLVLPWVHGASGQPFYINGGYTYNCGDHNPPRDAYAIDFSLPSGTPVAAVAAGTAHVGNDGTRDYGLYVWITHPGGFVSLYGHLSSVAVTDGAAVTQGQLIGNSGNSGHSFGAHLHFTVRQNATTAADGTSYMPEPMEGVDAHGNPKAYTGFGNVGFCKKTIGGPYYA